MTENESLLFLQRLASGDDEDPSADADLADRLEPAGGVDARRLRINATLESMRLARKRVVELNRDGVKTAIPSDLNPILQKFDRAFTRKKMPWYFDMLNLKEIEGYEAVVRANFRKSLERGDIDGAKGISERYGADINFDADVVDALLKSLDKGKVQESIAVYEHYRQDYDFRYAPGYPEAVAHALEKKLRNKDVKGAVEIQNTFAAGLDLCVLLGGEGALKKLFEKLLNEWVERGAKIIYEIAGKPAEYLKLAQETYFGILVSGDVCGAKRLENIFGQTLNSDSAEHQARSEEARRKGFLEALKSCRDLRSAQQLREAYEVDFEYSNAPEAQNILLDLYVHILALHGTQFAAQFKKEFADKIDFQASPDYVKIVKSHFWRHLRYGQTPEGALKIQASLGKSIDFEEEVKIAVDEFLAKLSRPIIRRDEKRAIRGQIRAIRKAFPTAIDWSIPQRSEGR